MFSIFQQQNDIIHTNNTVRLRVLLLVTYKRTVFRAQIYKYTSPRGGASVATFLLSGSGAHGDFMVFAGRKIECNPLLLYLWFTSGLLLVYKSVALLSLAIDVSQFQLPRPKLREAVVVALYLSLTPSLHKRLTRVTFKTASR